MSYFLSNMLFECDIIQLYGYPNLGVGVKLMNSED